MTQTESQKQKDLIRRLINNQRDEHTEHAFRAGHAGMQDFNRLVPILRGLPTDELHEWLDLIDDMAATHRYCDFCLGKITAYRMIITKDKPPLATRHALYRDIYARILQRQPRAEPRDFMKEVLDSMHHGKEHAHRQMHAFHWHEIAEAMKCDGRHQADKNGPAFSGDTFELNESPIQRRKRVLEAKVNADRRYEAIKKNSNRR